MLASYKRSLSSLALGDNGEMYLHHGHLSRVTVNHDSFCGGLNTAAKQTCISESCNTVNIILK